MTPEQIGDLERRTNESLRLSGRPERWCLHPDTTVTRRDGVDLKECDYCPSAVMAPAGYGFPRMPGYLYGPWTR